ncbi:MAG: ADP-forming succinate--CoA ligase subunit beta [Phycisphaerales bacterium]|nr:ADP-forming succinate--CoA ligase subunit beta [Phycisphaerales bacterium]
MKIHEYQAREILRNAGLPVPGSEVIDRSDQAAAAFRKLGAPKVVVKAQVHAGGRGKAGYVKLIDSPAEAEKLAAWMLANPMVSKQTGPQGVKVQKILLAPAVDIAKEYYLGVVLDRAKRTPVLMASAEGGVEIEEVAAKNPDAIKKAWFHPLLGLQPFQAREIAAAIGLTGDLAKQATDIMLRLARLFIEKDCSLAEINPLVLTPENKLLAIDAKFNFDDNATFRHADVAALFDPSEENAAELRAKEFNLSYISLEGNIGCLVNGAGLAMATMDIIKLHGGQPANFLDVGGSVTAEGAVEAFRIILSDPSVKAVLVNIFGGIAKCDVIADALIKAAQQIGFKLPVVVRLEGTNVDIARKMLKEANIPQLRPAADLTDAAKQVCAAV